MSFFIIRIICITKWHLFFLPVRNLKQLDTSASTHQTSSDSTALLSGLCIFYRLDFSVCFFVCFWDRVSICSLGGPRTCNPPASASWVLGLQASSGWPHCWLRRYGYPTENMGRHGFGSSCSPCPALNSSVHLHKSWPLAGPQFPDLWMLWLSGLIWRFLSPLLLGFYQIWIQIDAGVSANTNACLP
jgi:hypothetical protein